MNSKVPEIDSDDLKPEIMRRWQSKLLMTIICLISFYAGWQSHEAHSKKQCYEAGGQVISHNNLEICQFPKLS